MRKWLLLSVCVISLFLLFAGLPVSASKAYGFDTVTLSEDKVKQIWENINVRTITDPVSLSNIELPIVSFDVSENGEILLGFKENKIAVIDEDEVLHFFEFVTAGSYYVQWNDHNILLLLVRSSVVVELSQDGQLVNMILTDDHSMQNQSLWRQLINKTQINIGQSSYSMRNDMGILNFFASSYSQLVKTDSNGNSTMIYDVNSAQLAGTIIELIFVFIFCAIVVLGIAFPFFKMKRE